MAAMAKWNKKPRGQLKDIGYSSGDHGYGQLGKPTFQRYNATLGCFEDVPCPVDLGLHAAGLTGAPPKKSRIKVVVKPYTDETGAVIAPPPVPPPPPPLPQRVARYEEVVEEDGQVVVHVPDSAAGPDGVIRLLQVENEDGTVHYISAEQTGAEQDYTVEDAMEMILTEGNAVVEQGVADQHIVIQNVTTEEAPDAGQEPAEPEPETEPDWS
ncbi:uncharacterized protein LOC119108369 [Pollicipes pollicipes]|uniref:uncharacterized protein LOC119108369 n=1 Tax=Pollicipes pollicipes TaxID=41117 RepID=UPI00188502B9|nr:uncharacterized protein LOC119108369 [Pollicipes pollicipes]